MTTKITTSQLGIAALTLIVGIGIGYLIGASSSNNLPNPNAYDYLHPSEETWTTVPTPRADSQMEAFRQSLAFLNLSAHPGAKTNCIVHDSTSAIDYSTKFFPNWVSTHTPKTGYRWAIGLYPKICKEKVGDGTKNKPRISIFMIPTMQSVDPQKPKDILDYYTIRDTEDGKYYLKDAQRPKPGEKLAKDALFNNDDFIYDQGTIFP